MKRAPSRRLIASEISFSSSVLTRYSIENIGLMNCLSMNPERWAIHVMGAPSGEVSSGVVMSG